MARIAGVDLPRKKRIEAALPYIFGVGWSLARRILKETGIDPSLRVDDLKEEDIVKLREAVEKIPVEGSLKHQINLNVKRLKDIGSYRGMRHMRNLPSRGQRTRTNARTKRGRRSVIGGTKKTTL